MTSPPSSDDQKKVVMGIIASWIVSAVFLAVTYYALKDMQPFVIADDEQLIAVSLGLSALPLTIGIGWAARTRFFDQGIDGDTPAPGSPLDMTSRFIQNTSEQTLLFVIALLSFYYTAPGHTVALPLFAIWFCIARLAFWIGYRRENPVHRAFGFAGTFHPTIVILTISILTSAGWIPALNSN